MKQFDPISIKNRLVAYLRNDSNWNGILDDGVITSIFAAFGEETSGIVRYYEQLLKESRWALAQNKSSLLTQATRTGYLPRRPISAQGSIILSHQSILATAGIANIFTLTDVYTQLVANGSAYLGGTSGGFSIPVGTPIAKNPSTGLQYLSVGTTTNSSGAIIGSIQYGVASTSQPYGQYYCTIPVIEGVSSSFSATLTGLPSETITIPDTSVEDASNVFSSPLFNISAQLPNTSGSQPIAIYSDINLAPTNVYGCQIRLDPSNRPVLTFGNGSSGMQLPGKTVISVTYIRTSGSAGNITTSYVLSQVPSLISGIQLYCSNIPPLSTGIAGILGGKDLPSIEEIRSVAPTAYLSKSSIVSTSEYKSYISNLIPGILDVIVFSGTSFNSLSGTMIPSINYSYVNTLGQYSSTIDTTVQASLVGKNNPQDVVSIVSPLFVHMRINLRCSTPTPTTGQQAIDAGSLSTNIRASLYSTYGTLSQTFNSSLDFSPITTLASNLGAVKIQTPIIEAIADILPQTFLVDSSNTAGAYYYQSFSLDPSYLRMKNFSDGVPYCLKLNIIFNCISSSGSQACTFTGSNGISYSYSRTLFLVPDNSQPTSYTYQFAVLPSAGPLQSPASIGMIGRFEPSSKTCSECGHVNHDLKREDKEDNGRNQS